MVCRAWFTFFQGFYWLTCLRSAIRTLVSDMDRLQEQVIFTMAKSVYKETDKMDDGADSGNSSGIMSLNLMCVGLVTPYGRAPQVPNQRRSLHPSIIIIE